MLRARSRRRVIPPLLIMFAGIVLLVGSMTSFWLSRKMPATAEVDGGKPYRGILFEAVAPTDGTAGDAGASARVILMGSMHVLRPGDHPLPENYLNAFDAADTIVFELKPADTETVVDVLAVHSTYDDGAMLSAHLSEPGYQRAIEAAEREHIAIDSIERKQAWALAQALAGSALTHVGFKKDWGVDSYFRSKASGSGKEVAGFETLGDQLAVFSSLSDARQEALLAQVLNDMDQHPDYGLRGVAAWKAGDVESIAALREESKGADPALARALFDERHARWIEDIERRIAPGKTLLVIVGAAHLCGAGSVVDLLRKRGYEIDQR